MSIYAISDLHLPFFKNHSMEIFGDVWIDYEKKLEKNWRETIKESDTILIPGDISWATYIRDAVVDFKFIENLPGSKIISKGNHDYWWESASKLNKFNLENNLKTINFMHNNHFLRENSIICGTRGWKCPCDETFTEEDKKIYMRELNRLELSLSSRKIKKSLDSKLIVAMHYSPFNFKKEPSGFVDIMKKHRVDTCVYGHFHSKSFNQAVEGNFEGIDFKLISSDYLKFKPLKLYD